MKIQYKQGNCISHLHYAYQRSHRFSVHILLCANFKISDKFNSQEFHLFTSLLVNSFVGMQQSLHWHIFKAWKFLYKSNVVCMFPWVKLWFI